MGIILFTLKAEVNQADLADHEENTMNSVQITENHWQNDKLAKQPGLAGTGLEEIAPLAIAAGSTTMRTIEYICRCLEYDYMLLCLS